MTRAITGVQTFARFEILELQVRSMLREAADVAPDILDRISLGLKDPHYVEVIIVRGLYRHGNIGAEMRLSIDWRQHRLELSSAGSEVQAPTSWLEGIAPSISEGVRTFLIACEAAELSREWIVMYGQQFSADDVNRYLGFERAEPRKWERTPESSGDFALGPLREASLVVRLAI